MREFDFEITKRIEGDEPLVKVFNDALKRMGLAKMVCAPKSFKDFSNDELNTCPTHYSEILLCEKWIHEVVERLREWVSYIDEYLDEFDAEWRYYACSRRIECIKEYGGDDTDYDESGNIITEGLADEKLNGYTIIDELYKDDWRDLVQDTHPGDLSVLWSILQLDANVSVSEIFRHIGQEIPMYKMNEEGEMVVMTREDEDLMKVTNSVSADDIIKIINYVATVVFLMCTELSCANKYDNNEDMIKRIKRISESLLSLNFDSIEDK